jgi:hypothetical protein
MDLPRFTAYARLLSDGQQTPVFTLETEPLSVPFDEQRFEEVREWSRVMYGRPKAEVDAEIANRAQFDEPQPQRPSGGLASLLGGSPWKTTASSSDDD